MPQSTDKLKRLISVATHLTSTLNLDELLELIMRSAAELLEARSGSLLLLDEDTDELVFRVATAEPALVGQRMPADQGVAGQSLSSGKPVLIADASADDRLYREVDEAMGIATESLVAVPLVAKDKTLGVIEVMNKRSGPFTPEDEELAVALASLAAIAIDNANMYAALADAVVTARMSYRF
ncbi:MAG: GAF domain-containing protein [Acidimicrobiales bacterium]